MPAIYTTTYKRPLPITPFYIYPQHIVDLLESFIDDGKIFEREVTLSEDGLTKVVIWKFIDQDALDSWMHDPVIIEARSNSNKYNEITGIIVERTITVE